MPVPEIICPNCGAENSSEDEKCQVCGVDLSTPLPEEDQDLVVLADETEEDLPDLLHALKEEHQAQPPESSPDITPEEGDLFPDEDGDDQSVPDWLHRVRQRAREEDDAVGDLVRRVSAHEDRLNDPAPASPDESFEAWIGRLRDQARDKAASSSEVAEAQAADQETPPEEPDWLKRIRAEHEHLPEVDGAPVESDDLSDSENLPDWLLNLSEQEASELDPSSEPIDEKDSSGTEPIGVVDELEEESAKDLPAAPEEDLILAEKDRESDRSISSEPDLMPDPETDVAPEPAFEASLDGDSEAAHLQPEGDAAETGDDLQESLEEQSQEAVSEEPPDYEPSEERDQPFGPSEITRQIFPIPTSPDQSVTQQIRASAGRTERADWHDTLAEPDRDAITAAWVSKPAHLEISQKQRLQADLLSAMIADERAPRLPREKHGKSASWLLRLLIGLLLIMALVFSLFDGRDSDLNVEMIPPEVSLSPAGQALALDLANLSLEAEILLIFDYDAGFSDELVLVSNPVLSVLLQEGRPIFLASSSPSGPLLSRQLIEKHLREQNLLWVDMMMTDLGYFPLESYGAFGLSLYLENAESTDDLPELGPSLDLSSISAVFLLSDRYEGARIWIEQINALAPDMPLYLLVTAQAGPMLQPYWASGQIQGLLAGLPDGVAYETQVGDRGPAVRRWRGYQAGVLIMAALLVIGLIFGFEPASESDRRGDK